MELAIGDLISGWQLHLEGEGKGRQTRRTYLAYVEKYLTFISSLDVPWPLPTPAALDAWKVHLTRALKLQARSANGHISAVRGFYRWAQWSGHCGPTPVRDIRMVKPPRLLPKPIGEEDVLRMLRVTETRLERAVVEVLYSTGCRMNEFRLMRRSGVDFGRGTVIVMGKGAIERYVELGRPAKEALAAYLATRTDSSPWLWRGRFCHGRENPITAKVIRQMVADLAKRAGLPMHVWPHRLRHSFGTHLLDHGADVRVVQELMGHKHLASTQIYTEVSRTRQRKSHRDYHPRA